MKNVLTIFFKEMKRIFTDKRMLGALFIPGVVIFIVYTLMGNLMNSTMFETKISNTEYQIAYTENYNSDTTNAPQLLTYFDAYLSVTNNDSEKGNTVKKVMIQSSEVEDYKQKVIDGDIHLLIEFSDNFENKGVSVGNHNVSLFYNGNKEASSHLYTLFTAFVPEVYTDYKINYDFTNNTIIAANLVKDDVILKKIMSFVLPMVTVSLLYSTILTLVPESIAGEKERGTLASLLLTPAKRTSIVSGKILALTVAAIASGCVSFIGLLSSLPKMVGGMQLNLHPLAVLTLFFVVATTLVLLVAFGLTMSCFAKSTKEAASYLGPLTTVFIILAIVPALTGIKGLAYGFIPIINLSMCMSEIVTLGTINISLLGLTILSNVVFTALLIFITTKLFKKEKITVG